MESTSFLDNREDDLLTEAEDSGSSDCEPAPKRVKRESKEEVDKRMEKAFLGSDRIFELQDLDFAPDEKEGFDRVWRTLEANAAARKRLSAQTRTNVLAEQLYGSADLTDEDRKVCQLSELARERILTHFAYRRLSVKIS